MITIDLNCPNSTALALLGYARQIAELVGTDPNPIFNKMVKSDYENLIQVFIKYFGNFVILKR